MKQKFKNIFWAVLLTMLVLSFVSGAREITVLGGNHHGLFVVEDVHRDKVSIGGNTRGMFVAGDMGNFPPLLRLDYAKELAKAIAAAMENEGYVPQSHAPHTDESEISPYETPTEAGERTYDQSIQM